MKDYTMFLYRVSLFVMKEFYHSPKELQWAIIADTANGAIEQVTDLFDFTGCTIEKAVAIKEDYIVIPII